MDKDLNNNLLSKVLESIPEHISAATYLTELLGLSQGSAYRRLKGEIPFTLYEVYKLSNALDFSVDEIFGLTKRKLAIHDNRISEEFSPSNAFYSTLEIFYNEINFLSEGNDSYTIHAQNRIPLILAIFYPHLFRFFYYKWTHQLGAGRLRSYSFSDTVIPQDIMDLSNKILSYTGKIGSHIYILNREVYMNIMKEIQYYFKRRLISEDELNLLKSDLSKIIEDTEEFSYKGVDRFGDPISIYLSSFNIESNSIYAYSGGHSVSYFYPYTTNPMIIRNVEICTIHKNWLESLKKYSILITQSNEELMSEFFSQQLDHVANMHKITYYE